MSRADLGEFRRPSAAGCASALGAPAGLPCSAPLPTDAQIALGGEEIWLLAERAAYWPKQQTLLVADLHWGKSEAAQGLGIALPSTPLREDLARLSDAASRTGARRILVLGDLVHAKVGLTPGVVQEVAAWRGQHRHLEVMLLRGNHDRNLALPPAWSISSMSEGANEGPFCFTHAGQPSARGEATRIVWSGHLHPGCSLRGGGDALRLPCFVVSATSLVLPAFGSLTGLFLISPKRNQKIYVIAGRSVVAV